MTVMQSQASMQNQVPIHFPVPTLEEYLRRNAELYPDKVAVVCRGESVTYARLWERVQRRADELISQGLRPGEAWVMRALQDTDFLVTYFAIHWAGGVAVPLESTTSDERYAEVEARVKGSDIPCGTADILFTTGTTGQSKGVMLSHMAILADAENLIEAQGFSPQLTFIISGPLNHIGSLSKVWPVVLTGGTLCITEGMKNIHAFFAAMDRPDTRYATFLVPAGIRMLLALGKDKLETCAGAIEFIETGAAPMAQADMEQLCRLLPHTRLYNTYASTETGIICTYDYNAEPCVAGCLGRPMKHSQLFITDEGTVACRGKTLMTGYLGEPVLTASILRDGTLYTRDNGRLDPEGRLHLAGRADDVINVGGFKVAPSEVEDAAMALPEVADCVCIAVPHPLTGHALKLLVASAPGCVLDKRALARHLRARLEAYKVPLLYEETDRVHRTYNGKIDRKHYQ